MCWGRPRSRLRLWSDAVAEARPPDRSSRGRLPGRSFLPCPPPPDARHLAHKFPHHAPRITRLPAKLADLWLIYDLSSPRSADDASIRARPHAHPSPTTRCHPSPASATSAPATRRIQARRQPAASTPDDAPPSTPDDAPPSARATRRTQARRRPPRTRPTTRHHPRPATRRAQARRRARPPPRTTSALASGPSPSLTGMSVRHRGLPAARRSRAESTVDWAHRTDGGSGGETGVKQQPEIWAHRQTDARDPSAPARGRNRGAPRSPATGEAGDRGAQGRA